MHVHCGGAQCSAQWVGGSGDLYKGAPSAKQGFHFCQTSSTCNCGIIIHLFLQLLPEQAYTHLTAWLLTYLLIRPCYINSYKELRRCHIRV